MFFMKKFNISFLWKGAIFKILACFFFAANNAVVKLLSLPSANGAALSSYQIAFLQNFFGFLILLPFILPRGVSKLKVILPSLHFYRVVTAVLGVVLWYMAISYMPMAQAVALSFTGPIFTVIGSRVYLKERISIFRASGILLGVIGAFIITRPDKAFYADENILNWTILLPLTSAIAFVAAKLIGRELGAKGESPENLTFYLLFLMAPISLLLAIPSWITPAPEQWLWIFLLGMLSALAHYTTSCAYKYAEVTFLTPLGFSKLMFTAGLGFIFFGELATSVSLWIGAFIIMVGTFCLSLEEKFTPFVRSKAARFVNN